MQVTSRKTTLSKKHFYKNFPKTVKITVPQNL